MTIVPEIVSVVSEEVEEQTPERSEAALIPATEHYLRIEPSKGCVSLKLRSQRMVPDSTKS